ncbi:hypothetical protein ACFSTC_04505 [Nonomuraea ferruginea]
MGLAAVLAACSAGPGGAVQKPARAGNPRSSPTRPTARSPAELIPSCGAWWGIAPEIFTGLDVVEAVASAERRMAAPADIVHVYHRGKELFPNEKEIRLARDPEHPRLLLINWKPSLTHTWAEVVRRRRRRPDRPAGRPPQADVPRAVLPHHPPRAGERRRLGGGLRHAGQGLRGDVPSRGAPAAPQGRQERGHRHDLHGRPPTGRSSRGSRSSTRVTTWSTGWPWTPTPTTGCRTSAPW